ncbi:MAG: hypothetical protein ACI9YL_001139 [Luteibaculaceae bacterium]|jgi:hypothetical protein
MMELKTTMVLHVAMFFNLAILAILFVQSGLDKVFDFKGNLEWLKGHFGNSPLKGMVKLLLLKITIIEVLAGLFCLLGMVELVCWEGFYFAFAGIFLSAVALVSLFFGQRIAKDYPGAASLVPYFIVTLIGFILIYLVY